MTTTTGTTTELETLAARAAHLLAAVEPMNDELEQIKARFRELVAVGEDAQAAGLTIAIQPNRRFDPATAQMVLPPELLKLCEATAIDSKKAKQVLPPAVYQQCMKDAGKAKVVIR